MVSDLGDQGALLARVWLRAKLPDADLFLTNVKVSQFVVGDAAFGLGADAERTHLARFDCAIARVLEQVLFNPSLVSGDEEIELPTLGALVAAGPVGCATAEHFKDAAVCHVGECAGGRVNHPDLAAG